MLSHKHKCIFIHIPKCGGSSIEELIWPLKTDRTESNLWMGFISKYNNKYQTGGLQHLLSRQIRDEVGDEVFSAYFKFSIVRNPWDKAVSQFEYIKKRTDLQDFIGMSGEDCFPKYLELIQKKPHVQWESQYKFVMDENDNVLVDYLGRFEEFENDVYRILENIKMSTADKLPHNNKTVRTHYRDYYDTESKEIVQELYKIDIEKFGYIF